jgi:hypothetical protein
MAKNIDINQREKDICNGLVYGAGNINERRVEANRIPDFSMIGHVLWYHKITKDEAINILLKWQGNYSSELVNGVIKPTIEFLKEWKPENEGDFYRDLQSLINSIQKFINYSKQEPAYLSELLLLFEDTAVGYHSFKIALDRKFANQTNIKFIENEIGDLLPTLLISYCEWYKNNTINVSKAGGNKDENPYYKMLILIKMLAKAVNVYFPESPKSNKIKNNTGFQTKLNNEQLTNLFNELIKEENGFIALDTNINNWLNVFGESLPDNGNIESVKWCKNKQLLRELLTNIRHESFTIANIGRIIPEYFIDKNNNPILLAKNKVVLSQDSDKIKDILKKIATT